MAVLVVAGSILLGGTTWLALQQTSTVHPVLVRRLTAAGLVLCLALAAAALVAAMVQAP